MCNSTLNNFVINYFVFTLNLMQNIKSSMLLFLWTSLFIHFGQRRSTIGTINGSKILIYNLLFSLSRIMC